jgi:hypothetical protein
MATLSRVGSILFAIPLAVFGIQYLCYGRFVRGLPPVSGSLTALPFLAYPLGAVLVIAAIGILFLKAARNSARVVAAIFLFCFACLHIPYVAMHTHQPDPWTGAFEALALGGAALVLATVCSIQYGDRKGMGLATIGRWIYAVALPVFAIQHFMYARFIAGLVPAWIPARLFWAYFVGAAFLAASGARLADKMTYAAAVALGTMFLIWVVILHTPRALSARHGDELTSLFVAMAMSGGAWMIAGDARWRHP